MIPDKTEILRVIQFKTSRSGGKGGQNVNKVSSKVELIFNVDEAYFLSDDEKALLKLRLEKRTDTEGNIHIISQEDRSQLINKEKTILKLIELIKKSLQIKKERKALKIPKSVIENRLKSKGINSELKKLRRKPGLG